MTYLDKLLQSASLPLCAQDPEIPEKLRGVAGSLLDDLLKMLNKRNGFYALESALHVFPTHSGQAEIGISDWNENSLWRDNYKGLANNCLFFAEDIFGGQFCIRDNLIHTFDPETGVLEYLASDIEGWSNLIINDYEVLTGYTLGHQWQMKYGKIPPKKRLVPRIPFVAGGEFSLENLYLADAVEGMRYRGDIANQIKDLPDGANITFKIADV